MWLLRYSKDEPKDETYHINIIITSRNMSMLICNNLLILLYFIQ